MKVFHTHKFKWVRLISCIPIGTGEYAKYVELWRCECGEERVVTSVEFV